jgi:hypothetical protein
MWTVLLSEGMWTVICQKECGLYFCQKESNYLHALTHSVAEFMFISFYGSSWLEEGENTGHSSWGLGYWRRKTFDIQFLRTLVCVF